MYTVKELIETLKQCPQDYEVTFYCVDRQLYFNIYEVGIDTAEETVDLIGE